MNKKQIVIMAGVGLICFASSFTVGLFTRKPKEPADTGKTADGAVIVEDLADTANPIGPTGTSGYAQVNTFHAKQANLNKSLTVKQLNSLIFEMRTKLTEFKMKEKMLTEKEGRIQMAIDELHTNIKAMEELLNKLGVTLTSIKQKKTVLDERLLQINEIEKKNLIKTAAIYDKMKPLQSSEIIINLNKMNQLEYAVKLAYYMSERTSAKMLAEINNNKKESNLAAIISDRLRWIEEVKQ
jgi:flagellar motility protein MotE (MotC chaperone)